MIRDIFLRSGERRLRWGRGWRSGQTQSGGKKGKEWTARESTGRQALPWLPWLLNRVPRSIDQASDVDRNPSAREGSRFSGQAHSRGFPQLRLLLRDKLRTYVHFGTSVQRNAKRMNQRYFCNRSTSARKPSGKPLPKTFYSMWRPYNKICVPVSACNWIKPHTKHKGLLKRPSWSFLMRFRQARELSSFRKQTERSRILPNNGSALTKTMHDLHGFKRFLRMKNARRVIFTINASIQSS